jgi:hypothetical protein
MAGLRCRSIQARRASSLAWAASGEAIDQICMARRPEVATRANATSWAIEAAFDRSAFRTSAAPAATRGHGCSRTPSAAAPPRVHVVETLGPARRGRWFGARVHPSLDGHAEQQQADQQADHQRCGGRDRRRGDGRAPSEGEGGRHHRDQAGDPHPEEGSAVAHRAVGAEHQDEPEHQHRAGEHGEATGLDRRITIIEAILLAVVAIPAVYSGVASAKGGTESSLTLARALAARTSASRANTEAQTNRNFDGTAFDAWFSASVAGNEPAMALAEKRFSPELAVASTAWRATSPETNPNAPAGPTYMPEYEQPEKDQAVELDAKADELHAEGARAGGTADDYVRTTVFLASVLFLVGISGHFRVRSARYGLVAVGAGILVLAVTLLLLGTKPPL